MGDGTEQMRARYVTECACCGFVMFREKGKEITREESVCTYFQKVCIFFFRSFAYAVALSARYSFIKKVKLSLSTVLQDACIPLVELLSLSLCGTVPLY